MFHAELKVVGTVFGVNCDTFPCTLLDEEWLYGDAKCTLADTAGFTDCGTEAGAAIGIAETVNGFDTSDAA